MELIGQRILDYLETSRLYTEAGGADPERARPLLTSAERLVRKNRDAHEALGSVFRTLWLAENKPYALDWTMERYRTVVKRYEKLARKLERVRAAAERGEPLPRPEELGLVALRAP
jgi:hypothetical protein